MSQPTESDLLDALDRRARAATDGLASAVGTVPVPEPDLVEPGPSRTISPLLVAAAVVLLALVGAAIVGAGGGDEDGTVAGQPSLTQLVLSDPEASGYELVAAFDGTEEPPQGVEQLDQSISVQGPADSDDPWAAGVLSYALPADMTTLGGEPVELGGVDATYDTEGIAATVGWVDGDEVRYLVSSRRTRDQLVDLARVAVAEATPVGAPLPGQRILFTGTAADVFPTLVSTVGAPRGVRGVAYEQVGADDGLIVATRGGDGSRWRAASVAATSTEQVTVRGRDAIVARFGTDRSLIEVTWLEADGTLVRAAAGPTSDTDALVEVLDQLVPIDDGEFAELLRSHPVRSSAGESFSETGTEVIDGDSVPDRSVPLASVGLDDGDRRYEASLTRAAGGASMTLEARVDAPGGSSGVAIEVAGLDVEAAVRNDQPDGTVAIAVIVGPTEGPVAVLDAGSGQVVGHDGGSSATIEGSDHDVVLLVVTNARAEQQLVVVGTAPDGREIRIPV